MSKFLQFKLSPDDEIRRIDWYKAKKDPMKFKPLRSFFSPTCIENIANEMQDGVSVTVVTQKGEFVCGYVATNQIQHRFLVLRKEWVYE